MSNLHLCRDKSELERFIRMGESVHQDFKLRIDSARKIAPTICAFANTEGGRLLIGVKDSGKIKGIDPEEEYHMIEAACDLFIHPPLSFEYRVHHTVDGKLLEVLIHKSTEEAVCCKLDGTSIYYYRQEDEVFEASKIHIKSWFEKQENSILNLTKNETEILDYMDTEGELSFEEALEVSRLNPKELEAFMSKMLHWNIIGVGYDKEGCFYYSKQDTEQVYGTK